MKTILRYLVRYFKRANNPYLGPQQQKARKQANLLCGVIRSHSFSRMPPNEKIVAVAKMLSMYERDYGQAPALLTRTLLRLNDQLNSSVAKKFLEAHC